MNAGNRGNRYRTPLKDVRDLGSAKTGTEHFIHQRLTATALVLLGLWFVWFVIGLVGSDYLRAYQHADQALYAAKHAGRNRAYQHDGQLTLPMLQPA